MQKRFRPLPAHLRWLGMRGLKAIKIDRYLCIFKACVFGGAVRDLPPDFRPEGVSDWNNQVTPSWFRPRPVTLNEIVIAHILRTKHLFIDTLGERNSH
jgi:hypothetical protein